MVTISKAFSRTDLLGPEYPLILIDIVENIMNYYEELLQPIFFKIIMLKEDVFRNPLECFYGLYMKSYCIVDSVF